MTAFRGRQRVLMQPGRYTELFFADEATAYAAGHRPCAECRHADWRRFADLWAGVFGAARADDIDAALHEARLDGRARRSVPIHADAVPTGAMIIDDIGPVLRARDGWRRWSFDGYRKARVAGTARLLTPEPVAALMAKGLPVQLGGQWAVDGP